MPRFEHPNCQDGGLSYIRNNCTRMVLISSYAPGDSYAVVVSRILAAAAMSPADLVISSVGLNRRLTVANKTDASADASGGGPDSHVGLLNDTATEVLYVTEEDAAQSIIGGNAVAIAGFVITRTQPVAP